MSPIDAWLVARGSSLIELLGVLTGVANVWLTGRQQLLAWPIGIANAALYLVIFARAGLYSDTGLQVVYLLLSAYGWWHWARGGVARTPLVVSRTPWREGVAVCIATVAVWALLTAVTKRLPGAALPAIDAALVAGSLAAQWLMTRKRLECWIAWLVLDAGYVGLFVSRGLLLTAVLYGVYWLLAAVGLHLWSRSWQQRAA